MNHYEVIVLSFVTVYGLDSLYLDTLRRWRLRLHQKVTQNCVTSASVTEVWLSLSVLTGGPHLPLSAPPTPTQGMGRVLMKHVKLCKKKHLSISHVWDNCKRNNLTSEDVMDPKQLKTNIL